MSAVDSESSSALSRYALLASALAGQALDLSLVDDAGARTFTDGRTVFVPRARLPEAWLDVSLQALLLRSGSLAPSALEALLARPQRARSYLGLELARAVAEAGPLLPRRALEHPALAALPAPTRDVADSLERARRAPDAELEPPLAWGAILPARVLRGQPRAELVNAAQGSERARARPAREAGEREPSRLLAQMRAPVEPPIGFFGRLLAQLLALAPSGTGAKRSGAQGAELELPSVARLGSAPSSRRGARRGASGHEPLLQLGVHGYPEWDARRGRYLQNWVQVAEVEPHPDNAAERLLLPSPRSARLLYKSLRGLGLSFEPQGHQRQGDDVQVDALVRLRSDLVAGHVGDDRIYRASLRTRRDLGVLILLDCTGSTQDRAVDGATVFERQLAFALALTEALHRCGDRVACYGFHGWGRGLVRLQRLLSFGARPGASMRLRASWLSPSGYSRLGAAIRHGTRVLAERAGTPQRLLVLISDGIPYDQGYEGEHARADTRRALLEARRQGTACVCLCLGSSDEPAALASVFGGAHHLALNALAGAERPLRALFEGAIHDVRRRRPVG